jgi:hypothetical protein
MVLHCIRTIIRVGIDCYPFLAALYYNWLVYYWLILATSVRVYCIILQYGTAIETTVVSHHQYVVLDNTVRIGAAQHHSPFAISLASKTLHAFRTRPVESAPDAIQSCP